VAGTEPAWPAFDVNVAAQSMQIEAESIDQRLISVRLHQLSLPRWIPLPPQDLLFDPPTGVINLAADIGRKLILEERFEPGGRLAIEPMRQQARDFPIQPVVAVGDVFLFGGKKNERLSLPFNDRRRQPAIGPGPPEDDHWR